MPRMSVGVVKALLFDGHRRVRVFTDVLKRIVQSFPSS